MGTLKIIKLNTECPEIDTIAKWIFNEWGHLHPANTIENTIDRLKDRCRDNIIPSIYVAEMDSKPVGTASLIECDMDIRQQYTPWIASVYVTTSWRNQGIGTQLMKHIENMAGDLEVNKIYLFTPDRQKMYSKLGWQGIEELEYRGDNVTIMMKDLFDVMNAQPQCPF